MSRTSTGESSVARAVRIFEAFTPMETTLKVSEIARRAGLPVATASRLVAELAAHRLLEREPGGAVRMGVRMWELGSRASSTLSLRDAAMPFLQDLHAVVGQHVQLAILDEDDVLFVERLSGRDAVVNYSKIGGRLPLHATASGHVFLAYGSSEFRERISCQRLERYTTETITKPDRLRGALEEVRRQGYSVIAGHMHEQTAGIAVPVWNGMSVLEAALTMIVPNDERVLSHVPVLLAAARGITRALSGSHPPA